MGLGVRVEPETGEWESSMGKGPATVIKCPECETLWDGRTFNRMVTGCGCCGADCICMKISDEKAIMKMLNSRRNFT